MCVGLGDRRVYFHAEKRALVEFTNLILSKTRIFELCFSTCSLNETANVASRDRKRYDQAEVFSSVVKINASLITTLEQ